jgi:general secretion pathway protein A
MDTHAKSIRRGLLASSLVSVMLGVWLVAQLVPLEAVGLCARDQFAKAMGTAPAQEAARTPCLRLWSQNVALDVRTAAVFTLAHTLWISLALVLASALFGSAQQRMPAPLLSWEAGEEEAGTTLIGEPHANPEDLPFTWSDNGDHGGHEDRAAIPPLQEVTVLNAHRPADPVEAPQLQTVPPESRAGKTEGDSSAELRLVPLSHPSPEPSRLNGTGHYTEHWGLQEMPFENTPNPKYYFPSPNHEEALQRLLYGIEARKGAVILTGEIGCGKTLLSRTLMDHLAEDKYDTALIADPSFEDAQLFREVLYQLGIDSAGSELDLRHRLNDRLLDNLKRGVDTVLIIDEAQVIRDDQMFETLRLLLNFQLNDRFLLTLVLLGQPELRTRLQRLDQFYQRVAIRYHLGPFSEAEVASYIRFRLAVAGCKREIFTRDACSLIFQACGGIPRKVNTLCDLCLLLSAMEKATVVDRKIVGRAAVKVTHGIGQDHRLAEPLSSIRHQRVPLHT